MEVGVYLGEEDQGAEGFLAGFVADGEKGGWGSWGGEGLGEDDDARGKGEAPDLEAEFGWEKREEVKFIGGHP